MIVTVGSYNTDLTVVSSTHLPAVGETIMGDLYQAGGGKGANQAVGVARLRHSSYLLACLGGDEYGQSAMKRLEGEGICTGCMVFEPALPTGIALILVNRQGDNMIAVAPGANRALCPEHIDCNREQLQLAEIVLCEMAIPTETVEYAMRIARQGGARIIVTPSPPQQFSSKFMSMVDLIIPNETEAEALTGLTVTTIEQAGLAAQVLLGQGAKAALITLGKQGALYYSPQEQIYVPAYPVDAVDTTAAGDCFTAAFAVAWAEGRTMAQAMRFATAAAAISVTRKGAQSSLPTRQEVETFLKNVEQVQWI